MPQIPVVDIVLWFVVFLFSLSFHESAHALVSYWFGDHTGRLQGRITLNPLPHIDPIGTLLFPLMGFFSGGFGMFGWAKPVQTDPSQWRDPKRANIAVSGAGPLSNLILVIIAFVVIKALLIAGVFQPPFGNAGPFDVVVPAAGQASILIPVAKLLGIMLTLNLTLGVLNLIPIPPLDGSHILETLLPYHLAEAYGQLRPYGWILLLALIWLPFFRTLLWPIRAAALSLLFGS